MYRETVERPCRPGRRRAVRARRAAPRPSIPQGPREALAAERRFLEPRTRAVVAGRESAHRQLDLRSEARATRPTARPGHRPGPRRIFPPRPRATSTPADPVGTAAAAEPAPTSSRRGLVARASASGDEGGGRGGHALIYVRESPPGPWGANGPYRTRGRAGKSVRTSSETSSCREAQPQAPGRVQLNWQFAGKLRRFWLVPSVPAVVVKTQ